MNIHTAEEVGFSSERLTRIKRGMQGYIDRGSIAGIVTLVARRGCVVHHEKFGYQDLESKKAMELDTIFRIYSMTKSITSLALMMLYEQARFHLDDPLSKFLPQFGKVKVLGSDGKLQDLEREITIHHLLTHTAGLSYGDEGDSAVDALYGEADIWNPEIDTQEMVRRIASLPLRFQPGDDWHYSLATDVVGHLVELLSGMSLEQYFFDKIFRLLGMADTGFSVPPEKADRFATLYGAKGEDPLAVIDGKTGGEYFNVRLFCGGHGLVSTAADYLRFCQLILNQGELDGIRLLGRKTVEWMTMNHLPGSLLPIYISGEEMPGLGFGLGFSVMMDISRADMMGSEGAFGWGGWASTHFWIDPRESLIGILMLQHIPSGTYPIHKDLRALVYQALID